MPNLLTIDELKDKLHVDYIANVVTEAKQKREENINLFFEIDRKKLDYEKLEKRLQLYTTLSNEKVCIQYPGKESNETPKKPYDFRPKLIMSDGEVMQDASFGFIWDLLDGISQRHNDYLCLVAAVFWYMGYMYEYAKTKDQCLCEIIEIDKPNEREMIKRSGYVELEWWHLAFDDDIWYSLNNYIGMIPIDESHLISFEALMKFVDLLLQNEDCKYFYKKKILEKKEDYNLQNGRTNTADANMAIIMYFEKRCSFSDIANKIQQGMGMPRFRKADYHIVTDEIISN